MTRHAFTARTWAVLAVIAGLLVIVLGRVVLDDPAPAGGDAPAVTEQPTPEPTAPEPTTGEPAALRDEDAALAAATAYLAAFFDTTRPTAAWRTAYEAHATGSLAAFNETVPQAAVPDGPATGIALAGFTPGYAEFHADLPDGTELHGSVVWDTDTWAVDELAPEPPEPTTTPTPETEEGGR